jgi:protein-S-isoprenylcysteine O-methyltransferase Ste14
LPSTRSPVRPRSPALKREKSRARHGGHQSGRPAATSSSSSPLAGVWLAFRSLLWTALLPGVFAGFVPWRYFGLGAVAFDARKPLHWTGLVAILLGVVLLAACIWKFARNGRGTLSPADPPRELVVQGLYRHVRNPMYLSVTLIVLGEALVAASPGLLVYWSVWFAAVNLFVVAYEEPGLRREFGSAYEQYAKLVRRWIPRLRAYRVSG